jgi:hypothetical protein
MAPQGQEADHRVVEHGGKAGLAADGVGAFLPAVFLGEVVGQAGDDLIAALGVITAQGSDVDLWHGHTVLLLTTVRRSLERRRGLRAGASVRVSVMLPRTPR